MRLEKIRNISVLGAGTMGHGIAQTFLMGGYPVRLYDVKEAILKNARVHIQKNLELFCQAGLVKKQAIKPALGKLTTTTDLEQAVAGSDFIVEAAPENLKLKQDLFQKVESFCRKEAILASNTSSLTLKEMGVRVKNKARLVVTHWFNPPHIVPTVEVVRGKETSQETLKTTYQLMTRLRKMPVLVNKELPGFIVNRIQVAMVREVFDLYEKGVATAADIDRAVKGSFGFRLASIGPLLTADLGGLDVWYQAGQNLLPQIKSSTKPSQTLKRLVAQGHLGVKSGRGFYNYAVDFSKAELDDLIQKRDREFLNRLKTLYWNPQKSG
jgi:3-hydroxybutyryl-CoA dehydrogenase